MKSLGKKLTRTRFPAVRKALPTEYAALSDKAVRDMLKDLVPQAKPEQVEVAFTALALKKGPQVLKSAWNALNPLKKTRTPAPQAQPKKSAVSASPRFAGPPLFASPHTLAQGPGPLAFAPALGGYFAGAYAPPGAGHKSQYAWPAPFYSPWYYPPGGFHSAQPHALGAQPLQAGNQVAARRATWQATRQATRQTRAKGARTQTPGNSRAAMVQAPSVSPGASQSKETVEGLSALYELLSHPQTVEAVAAAMEPAQTSAPMRVGTRSVPGEAFVSALALFADRALAEMERSPHDEAVSHLFEADGTPRCDLHDAQQHAALLLSDLRNAENDPRFLDSAQDSAPHVVDADEALLENALQEVGDAPDAEEDDEDGDFVQEEFDETDDNEDQLY